MQGELQAAAAVKHRFGVFEFQHRLKGDKSPPDHHGCTPFGTHAEHLISVYEDRRHVERATVFIRPLGAFTVETSLSTPGLEAKRMLGKAAGTRVQRPLGEDPLRCICQSNLSRVCEPLAGWLVHGRRSSSLRAQCTEPASSLSRRVHDPLAVTASRGTSSCCSIPHFACWHLGVACSSPR